MLKHNSAGQARLWLERLEERYALSTLLGEVPANVPAHVPSPGEPPALVAAAVSNQQHAVPIHLSTQITSDGSGLVTYTGVGGHLGRWSGAGAIENVVVDETASHITVNGTATMTAANGDELVCSFSASFNTTTGLGEVTVTFTGGTGRFDGVSGSTSLDCHVISDPADPLNFVCNNEGFGTLVCSHWHR